MSPREIVAGLPLATGSILISMAILPPIVFEGGVFILEWVGSFLAFYGLSYIAGLRRSITISGVVLVLGTLGDIMILGGITPIDWTVANYMVFIHAALGCLAGHFIVTRIHGP